MAKARWRAFPYPDQDYDYPDPALERRWRRLHQGDREPYPYAAYLKKLASAHEGIRPASFEDAAVLLRDAWRAYHGGRFADSVRLGLSAGPVGYNVANKASNIYATYLEPDDAKKLGLFRESARRAEESSIATALAQGLAGKVRTSLEHAIALDPKHAEAHIAFGAFHAELIAKVGRLVGSLTYGVTKEAGIGHFRTALRLLPHSAIARIEYARALLAMFGRSRKNEAMRLLEEAAGLSPADAMERLDVEMAKSALLD